LERTRLARRRQVGLIWDKIVAKGDHIRNGTRGKLGKREKEKQRWTNGRMNKGWRFSNKAIMVCARGPSDTLLLRCPKGLGLQTKVQERSLVKSLEEPPRSFQRQTGRFPYSKRKSSPLSCMASIRIQSRCKEDAQNTMRKSESGGKRVERV